MQQRFLIPSAVVEPASGRPSNAAGGRKHAPHTLTKAEKPPSFYGRLQRLAAGRKVFVNHTRPILPPIESRRAPRPRPTETCGPQGAPPDRHEESRMRTTVIMMLLAATAANGVVLA